MLLARRSLLCTGGSDVEEDERKKEDREED